MRYQKSTYSCGAACVVNALRCFGKKVSEKSVRAYSYTTKENGTDDHGIIAGLRGLGFDGEYFEVSSVNDAIVSLCFPVIICVQNLQHWVVVIGQNTSGHYFVIDPARTIENKKENGVHVLSKSRLIEIWRAKRNKKKKFCGVICRKK